MNDDQHDEYVVHGATSLLETRQDTACDGSEGSSVVFASSGAGFECDNPTDPQNLGLVRPNVPTSPGLLGHFSR